MTDKTDPVAILHAQLDTRHRTTVVPGQSLPPVVVVSETALRAALDELERLRAQTSSIPSAVLGGTDDGRLRIICPACPWDVTYPSLDLITATAIVREHVATHDPICECGCQPGGICGCTVHDCDCIGDCPVCDRDEAERQSELTGSLS